MLIKENKEEMAHIFSLTLAEKLESGIISEDDAILKVETFLRKIEEESSEEIWKFIKLL